MHPQTSKGSYQSGQMGLTVTQLAYAFGGSNPSLPTQKRRFSMRSVFFCFIATIKNPGSAAGHAACGDP